MGHVQVYVCQGALYCGVNFTADRSSGVPQSQAIMETKHDSLARFIHIMSSLAQVYDLPLTSLHIFYDLQGGLIAFNRNTSIFLNLRYFEAWRKDHQSYFATYAYIDDMSPDDVDVCAGSLNKAYISW
jgi:hypothetical protein